MIIVYPALISRAVSENAVPGICKSLENYIMINQQDILINQVNTQPIGQRFGKIRQVGNKLIARESVIIDEQPGVPPGSTPGTKTKYDQEQQKLSKEWNDLEKQQKAFDSKIKEIEDREKRIKSGEDKIALDREKFTYQKRKDQIQSRMDRIRELEKKLEVLAAKEEEEEKQRKKEEREDKKEQEKTEKENREKLEKAKKAAVSVKAGDMKSITLEPTYMTIEHIDGNGVRTNRFLGVKVVPLRVRSDVKLSHLILVDAQMNSLAAFLVGFGRKTLRSIYKFIDRYWFRRTATGDPRTDIIMGRTGMGDKSQSFIVLSKQEDVDEFFLDNISRVNRLFKMGWSNIVIADDIARVAHFCMTDLRGMCNVVPYSMIYQQLGQASAYKDMEDAKKASSSIFKVSQRLSKVLGEWRAINKLDQYSQLNEGHKDE